MKTPALSPPFLGPQLPQYPHLIQVCRTTAVRVNGPGISSSSSPTPTLNIYVSFTEQLEPTTLNLRDREPCLVLDTNGGGLSAGYYTCRLIGSYNGLPLYAAGDRVASGGGSSTSPSETTTTSSIVIPAVGSTVVIPVASSTGYAIGDIVELSDGTNLVYGYVTAVTDGTHITFETIYVKQGSAGNTLLLGAFVRFCCPSVVLGKPSLPTSSTSGFPYLPTMLGQPVGSPTVITGFSPFVYDLTNGILWFWDGTQWNPANPGLLRGITSGATAAYGDIISGNTASGSFTVTLPPVKANEEITVTKSSADVNTITVNGVTLSSQYDSVTWISDGVSWFVKSKATASAVAAGGATGSIQWNNAGALDGFGLYTAADQTVQFDSAGDARGAHAVDLQTERSNVNQVAEGANSVITGGENNRITGSASTHGVIGGGVSNLINDIANCVIGGGSANSIAGETSCIPGGKNNTVAAGHDNSFLLGTGLFTTGTKQILIGVCTDLSQGSGYIIQGKSSTATRHMASWGTFWNVATDASRCAGAILSVYDFNAAREVFSAYANGSVVLMSWFGATEVVQQVDGAALTNNVTAGGTTDTIANYTDLVIYANDAAAIRNDIYQLARKLKIVNDALRAYGLLT